MSSRELTPTLAGGGELGDGVGVEVEADDLVAGEAETLRHVAAHLAEADDSEFHVSCSFTCFAENLDSELWRGLAFELRG